MSSLESPLEDDDEMECDPESHNWHNQAPGVLWCYECGAMAEFRIMEDDEIEDVSK